MNKSGFLSVFHYSENSLRLAGNMKANKIIILMSICLLPAKFEVLTDEYCNWEVFQPRCSSNEIILIDEAVYGRRKLGRCLMDEGSPSETFLEDPKFLGCFVDVRHILEPLCAGNNQCDVSVAKIKTETPCHKWNKLYLEVGYKCIQVVRDNRHCTISVTTDEQHLSAQLTSKEGKCGTKLHPWTVDVLSGQRIKFSLTSFLAGSNFSEYGKQFIYFQQGLPIRSKECSTFGKIVDKNSKKEITICVGTDASMKSFTQTMMDSNSAEITLNSGVSNTGLILAIEATGCSDLIPPADAWLKRTENEATIGCYSTRLRWQLKCQGQRWVGVIGNCSHGHSQVDIRDPAVKETSSDANDQLIQIVSIAMVGFVICFLIICIGVVFLNRYYAMNKMRNIKNMEKIKGEMTTYAVQRGYHFDQKSGMAFDPFNATRTDTLVAKEMSAKQNDGQYFELDQALINSEGANA